jgi:hypothetical protein
MPGYSDIPPEFKKPSNKWNQLFNQWFFKGIGDAKFTPKEGVDTNKALRHINTIMRSYEPSHEHKEAAVAFLLNEWFEDIQIQVESVSA